MAGLLSTASIPKLADPILQRAETDIEAKVTQNLKADYTKIVVSGMKILFDPKTHQMMVDGLKHSPDMSANVSTMATSILWMIYQQVQHAPAFNLNTFAPAAGPASITLMLQMLDFAEKTKVVQVTPDLLAQCTAKTKDAYLAKFKITPQAVQQVTSAGGQKPVGA